MAWTYQDELERLGYMLNDSENDLSELSCQLAELQFKYDMAKQDYAANKDAYNYFVANMPEDSSLECNRG